jgi:hypothetical protein
MPNPDPGTTLVVDIALGEIDSTLDGALLLDADSSADTQPPIRTQLAGFIVPSYVAVDGQPRADAPQGCRLGSVAGARALSQVTAPPDPASLNLGSWARWLPRAVDLEPPANGGRRWFPLGWAHTSANPRMSLYSIIPTGTGRGPYGAASPGIDEGYVYEGFGRKMSRPAMVFDGMSAAAIDPTTLFDSCTFGLVAVFRPSPLPYFGIFEANAAAGEPLVYRYSHGRLDVFQNETRVLSHETQKPAHSAVVLLVSMDSASDTGRMVVIDGTRTTRTFAIDGLDFVSMNGVIGALGQGTNASPWRYGSQMDILELDIWNRALDFPELQSAATLLALAYGVV